MSIENDPESYKKRKVAKGRRIFNEGEAGDFAYIVETGEIGIYKMIEGIEIEITTLNPGEIFGEIAVLDGRERMASAIALMDSTLILVTPKTLETRIAQADKFVKTLLSIFMTNLRDTHKTYKSPRYTYEGHLKSMERHSNALRDLIQISHDDAFIEKGGEVIKTLRECCDKLRELEEENCKK